MISDPSGGGADGDAAAIGHAVRAGRERLALSTRELASRIGTSQPFVSNIENGHLFPSLRTLQRLATALEVPIGELLPAREQLQFMPATSGMRRRRAGETPARSLVEGRALAAHRVELRPGEIQARPFVHEGEDFVLVLEGTMHLLREGIAPEALERGGSTWLDGTAPHRLAVMPETDSPGVAIIVTLLGAEEHKP